MLDDSNSQHSKRNAVSTGVYLFLLLLLHKLKLGPSQTLVQTLAHASMSLQRFESCPKASRGDKIVHSGGHAEDVGCIYDDDDDDDDEDEDEPMRMMTMIIITIIIV